MQVLLISSFLVFCSVNADVYIHSGRGSNNRLDEANRERNNANRMFDSQNNDRGGYNVGKLNFIESAEVPISWTNQHGCGSDDVKHCEIIVQAMCDDMIRDGTTTQTIPENPVNCRNFNCDTDVKYGRHESYDYYQSCKQRKRNKGLFTASQQPNREDATRTRQNPGGTRHAYECPEERDYYPYWAPTPWIDIAIYTKDTGKCELLQKESANVKSRWYCDVPEDVADANNFGNGIGKTPNNRVECESLDCFDEADGSSTCATWTEVLPNNCGEPQCLASAPTRTNHLGLVGGEEQWTFNWKVPGCLIPENKAEQSCVFRVRYNISEDYDASAPDGVDLENAGFVSGMANVDNSKFTSLIPSVDADFNRKSGGGNAATRPSILPLWRKYGISDEEVGYDPDTKTIANADNGNNGQGLGAKRDWTLRNNPKLDYSGQDYDGFRMRLQLAVNTAQYGRTFQDRTHVSFVQRRPDNIGMAKIKTLTTSGKRGNIVQTFPGTEYMFHPAEMTIRQWDYLHLTWSGSNTNPDNNDGQGKKGTDRNNLCPINPAAYSGNTDRASSETDTGYQQSGNGVGRDDAKNSLGRAYPAFVNPPEGYVLSDPLSDCGSAEVAVDHFGGLSKDDVEAACTLRRDSAANFDYGNMEELDDAGTSFNLAPKQVKEVGCWALMGTRNNNFSNRAQKMMFCVSAGDFGKGTVGPAGGTVWSSSASLIVPPQAMSSITDFKLESTPVADSSVVSDEWTVLPETLPSLWSDNGDRIGMVWLNMPYSQRALSSPYVQHWEGGEDGGWVDVNADEFLAETDSDGIEMTLARVGIAEGGNYRVKDKPNAGAIAAIVLAGCVFIGVVMFLIWYKFYRDPTKAVDDFTDI